MISIQFATWRFNFNIQGQKFNKICICVCMCESESAILLSKNIYLIEMLCEIDWKTYCWLMMHRLKTNYVCKWWKGLNWFSFSIEITHPTALYFYTAMTHVSSRDLCFFPFIRTQKSNINLLNEWKKKTTKIALNLIRIAPLI